MEPKFVAKEGWVEIVIDNSCDYEKFEHAAAILEKEFEVIFAEKLHHMDDVYWDFVYRECELTLHYNHFCGIALFSKRFEKSTDADNESAKEIGALLFEKLNSIS